jgi:hypothetical protein
MPLGIFEVLGAMRGDVQHAGLFFRCKRMNKR